MHIKFLPPPYVIRDGMQSVQDAEQCFAMSDATSSSDESHLPKFLSSSHVNPIMSFMTMSGESAHAAAVPLLLNELKPVLAERKSGSMGSWGGAIE
jgi:hypothetical protein